MPSPETRQLGSGRSPEPHPANERRRAGHRGTGGASSRDPLDTSPLRRRDFVVHPKLHKVLADRAGAFEAGAFDWGTAEALAIGSLAHRWHSRAVGRGGFAPGHLQSSTCRAHFVRYGLRVDAAPTADRRRYQGPNRRLAALRVRRGGFRVRILGRVAGGLCGLGSAVRRLHQWGSSDHRPIHGGWRGQMGPTVGSHASPSPRLRGTRTGTFVSSYRTLPRALRSTRTCGSSSPRPAASTFTCCDGKRCCDRASP